ncbi:MAG: hypothetical protein A3F70_09410 [Acidobacteria bacterium RIFCSPLOWO2_12_FULL_67_14]|nr:MAG: hypothetical protein A3H29_01780 [Acidobacteria bacterium RIFCSPLOWO2_02_FULL_67_21]OFW40708.1 MAG: hypothetical protein A3F70_09410 [Acidobacteria bacterium RIFCSPLOWO2_12_FULL_67_14]
MNRTSTFSYTRRRVLGVLVLAAALATGAAGAEVILTIDDAGFLSGAAERVRRVDLVQLTQALSRAGLDPPPRVHVILIPEHDPRARATPAWIVGRAFEPQDVVIFPERAASYPYDSLEAIVQHEIVHLALSARADGRTLPRWFHEGVAVSVAAGWGVTGQLRLLFAASGRLPVREVARLFQSDSQPGAAQAYMLAAALVDDLRRRHGAAVPGAVARRVAGGAPFEQALALETGETVDEATARAWSFYLGWTSWILFLTGTNAVWTAILALACIAFLVQVRRRFRRRRQWDEEGY